MTALYQTQKITYPFKHEPINDDIGWLIDAILL
jgi:hypothetical protein